MEKEDVQNENTQKQNIQQNIQKQNIRVIITNVLYGTAEEETVPAWEKEVEIDEHTTLAELVGLADLSHYYPLSGVFSWNSQEIPYVVSDGTVRWNQPYSQVRVSDFIRTHQIQDSVLYAEGGYPQAGGPGFLPLMELWEAAYPVIEQILTIVEIGGLAIGAGKWAASLFRKKGVPPQTCFDFLFSREKWNAFELAELLEIMPEEAKKLLDVSGYRYDRSIMMYVQQPEALDMKEKLGKVNVHES